MDDVVPELLPLVTAAAEHGWEVKIDGEDDIRVRKPGGGAYAVSVYRNEDDGVLMMFSSWCWDFEQGEYYYSDDVLFDAEAAIRYLSGDVNAVG